MSTDPPSGWSRQPLGSLADYINGFGFSPEQWAERGLPIVRIENMRDPDAAANFYDGDLPDRFKVLPGDLLLSWSATLMALVWDRPPAWVNQHIFRVIPRQSIDRSYLHHLLDAALAQLANQSHGTTMKHVKRSDLLPFEVWVAPTSEQPRIGQILNTVDDAIRWTENAIGKLEQMEHGILNDLLTRGVNEEGESRDPYERPDLFDGTRLGPISKSLTVHSVGELLSCRPKNGHSPQEADNWTGTWMLGLGCLTSSGFTPRQLKAAPKSNPALTAALLREGDLLMSRSNTRELVGLVGRYQDVGAPCTYPDLMMRLVPNEKVSAAFLELSLRTQSCRRQIQSMASGTSGSMVKIGSAAVMNLNVVVPSRDEQERIVAAYGVPQLRIAREVDALCKLRFLREGLMNDLLTGRVRVKVDSKDAA
jgi:type I restriction enzyme S subunit